MGPYSGEAGITLTATQVAGPGTVTFAWDAVSGDTAHATAQFFIDSDTAHAVSATIHTNWEGRTDTSAEIPSGSHTLTWRISQSSPNSDVGIQLANLRFTPDVTKDTVKTEITTLQGYTQPAMFTNNNHKAFDAKLDAVYKLVDVGTATSYAQAMDKIQIDLMPKTDGVAPDWVTGTDSQGVSYQQTVYNALQTLYDHIETLQTVGFPV